MSATPPFAGITTFARAAHRTEVRAGEVAVMGVPFDSSVSNRPGTRFGPRAIREQSLLLWGYNPAQNIDPFQTLNLVDVGDTDVIPVDIEATHREIERRASEILSAGARLVTLGGEHSISLPLLRAHAKKHGPLAVVHFDAHLDTWPEEYPGYPYSHGTPFYHALKEGLIDRNAYVQLGIRGPTYAAHDRSDAEALGTRILSCDTIRERGIRPIIAEVREIVGTRPVYVSLDIDAADPAFAPGTGTPEIGGFASYELLQLVRGLKGLSFTGFDVVEVSPPYDPTAITSILAANLAYEFLSLMALQ